MNAYFDDVTITYTPSAIKTELFGFTIKMRQDSATDKFEKVVVDGKEQWIYRETEHNITNMRTKGVGREVPLSQ